MEKDIGEPSKREILQALMKEYKFTEDSKFYRYTLRKTLHAYQGEDAVKGEKRSQTLIIDHYHQRKRLRASALEDPGINVTSAPSDAYKDYGDILLEVRLGDAIEAGGFLYMDVGSTVNNAWYITLPEGTTIPAKVIVDISRYQ